MGGIERHVTSRRHFLQQGLLGAAAVAGGSFLHTIGVGPSRAYAGGAGAPDRGGEPGSLILIWLSGGASQLETFDPKPGTRIGGPTKGVKTPIRGVQLAEGLPRTAEIFDRFSLVRSMVTREGAHERGHFLMHTSYLPNPAVSIPTIGAWCAHGLGAKDLEIPRNITILEPSMPGGALGTDLDPLMIGNPDRPLDDVKPRRDGSRLERRLALLEAKERQFVTPRAKKGDDNAAGYRAEVARAARKFMMGELSAFEIEKEPESVRRRYGDSGFGKGCLLARRLVEAGVPAIEVRLGNWDGHAANFLLTGNLTPSLDAGLSSLVTDLEERDLLDRTVVVVATEFGRTPSINPADGRDHHPNGFSVAMAGGKLRRGAVLGETDSAGSGMPSDPVTAPDLHATILKALGLDPKEEVWTDIGRPLPATDGGKPIARLLQG